MINCILQKAMCLIIYVCPNLLGQPYDCFSASEVTLDMGLYKSCYSLSFIDSQATGTGYFMCTKVMISQD